MVSVQLGSTGARICRINAVRRSRYAHSTEQRRRIRVGATDNIFSYRQPEPITKDVEIHSNPKGALAAWTVSIKDNICTTDMPTTCASKMLEGYMSPFDATVVHLLRNAGAHIVGKTNCDEFGMGAANTNSVYGPVINPASQEDEEPRVAGGSSGGAAASVAANMCRVALGSDTGGSVRLPAAYCGVYGLRPSYGLISRWGLVSYAESLDTIGIMANRSADVRQVFDILSKFDERDPTSAPDEVRQQAELCADRAMTGKGMAGRGSLKGFRVGVPQECFASEVHDRVKPALRQALSALRDAGAEVVPVHIASAKYALGAYYVLASAEASSSLARYDGVRYGQRTTSHSDEEKMADDRRGFAKHIARTRSTAFGQEVQKRLLLGTYALTSSLFDNYFLQAERVRQLVRRDYDKVFTIANVLSATTSDKGSARSTDEDTGVHALVQPSAVDIAPTLSEAESSGWAGCTQDLLSVPASLAGLPAITVPVAKADGMPVGVTLTTQWGCESVLWRLLEHVGP